MQKDITISAITGIPEITKGTDLGLIIYQALQKQKLELINKDILVVTQKIVSKAEGRLVDPKTIKPSQFAKTLAKNGKKDPSVYEIILSESERIVRHDQGLLITQTPHGFTMANAGVDESNVPGGNVTLLPQDPDASAEKIRSSLIKHANNQTLQIAIIISDTWGRPWRNGQVNVCIGSAGIDVIMDYRGENDTTGNTLEVSQIAVGDELASSAELIMGKIDHVPLALIRGYEYVPSSDGSKKLVRDPKSDLFR